MSREIKFRAWDSLENEYIYFELKDYMTIQSFIAYTGEFYCKLTIEQYTGIKDKSGVEIYEGDILQSCYPCGTIIDKDLVVKFTPHLRASNGYRQANWNKCEVIGNIHQNPELIESK